MPLKRFIAIVLVALIMFADSGQTIFAHTCLKSKVTSFSLGSVADCDDDEEEKGCCDKKEHKDDDCRIGNKDCCTVSGVFAKQVFPSDELKLKKTQTCENAIAVFEVQPLFVLHTFPINTPVNDTGLHLPYRSSPSFIQVFRC